MTVWPARQPAWRVAVTRDEPAAGPLAGALRLEGFAPVVCAVLLEAAPADPAPLAQVAASLDDVEWVVVASARSVRALTRACGATWAAQVRTATVGQATADALRAAGATAPLVGAGDGARGLWAALREVGPWTGRRVLVPTTPGGGRLLIDALASAGAVVREVEAYRMNPRPGRDIAADWASAAPDAAVVASPRVVHTLADAVGAQALTSLHAVVAIGTTTAAALAARSVPCAVPPTASFRDAARTLAGLRTAGTAKVRR